MGVTHKILHGNISKGHLKNGAINSPQKVIVGKNSGVKCDVVKGEGHLALMSAGVLSARGGPDGDSEGESETGFLLCLGVDGGVE